MPEGIEISSRGGSQRPRSWPRRLRRSVYALGAVLAGYYVLCLVGLVYLRFLPPVGTVVHAQRVTESVLAGQGAVRDYRWRSADDISPHLTRAVVAAEDGRFYRHRGFDWEELRRARERARERGEPMRGASTITHQLIKNLYFTTHRNPVRKAYEWALTPPAEWILGKDRIILLYVNVVEMGPGVYGAEAAAQHYYGVPASQLTRYQAASLAAVLPNPRQRTPQGMGSYTNVILGRMGQMGW